MFAAIGAGIVMGFAVALSAVGFTVIHLGTKPVNFANGQFMLIGGYVVWFLGAAHHVPFAIAALAAIACGAIAGVIVDRFVIEWLRNASLLAQVGRRRIDRLQSVDRAEGRHQPAQVRGIEPMFEQ